MVEALFKALSAGLSLWQHKDARQYLDRVIELKKEWYEEYNKSRPDDAVLDNIELELHHITSSFNSAVGVTYSKDK